RKEANEPPPVGHLPRTAQTRGSSRTRIVASAIHDATVDLPQCAAVLPPKCSRRHEKDNGNCKGKTLPSRGSSIEERQGSKPRFLSGVRLRMPVETNDYPQETRS